MCPFCVLFSLSPSLRSPFGGPVRRIFACRGHDRALGKKLIWFEGDGVAPASEKGPENERRRQRKQDAGEGLMEGSTTSGASEGQRSPAGPGHVRPSGNN